MEVIVYTNSENQNRKRLENEIAIISNLKPLVALDFNNLFDILRQKISGEVIIVFLITIEDELDFLISNRDKLFNSLYLIILPDRVENLVTKGLSLYPRYLADPNHKFRDVCAVLNKMIQNNREETKALQPENPDQSYLRENHDGVDIKNSIGS